MSDIKIVIFCFFFFLSFFLSDYFLPRISLGSPSYPLTLKIGGLKLKGHKSMNHRCSALSSFSHGQYSKMHVLHVYGYTLSMWTYMCPSEGRGTRLMSGITLMILPHYLSKQVPYPNRQSLLI